MTDVLGSILLVGITVAVTAGLALMILSFPRPVDRIEASVSVGLSPGNGGWDTGDEQVVARHAGGEAIPAGQVRLAFGRNGGALTVLGAGELGAPLADGRFSIGEQVAGTTTIARGDEVLAYLATQGGDGQVLALGTVVAGEDTVIGPGSGCAPDTAAPTVSLAQTPLDLSTSRGTSSVTVVASVDDLCSGVDEAVDPVLRYRIVPGPLPGPTGFTDLAGTQAGSQWTFTIPAPGGLGWPAASGQTLEYQIVGMADTASPPNTGSSAVVTDPIQLIGTRKYVTEPGGIVTPIAGSLGATSGNLGADDGLDALLAESCVLGPAASGVQSVCTLTSAGHTVVAGVVTGVASNHRSDNARSTQGAAATVQATGFDVPALPASPGTVELFVEGMRTAAGPAALTLQLSTTGCGGAFTAVGASISLGNAEATTYRTVSGTHLPAAIEGFCVRAVTAGTGTPVLIDTLGLRLTYNPTTTVGHDANLRLEWTSMGAGTSGLLELEYTAAAGESYTVEKWNGISWSACSGTLAATVPTTFTCALTSAELLSGSPRVRILGAADAGAPSTLALDYARMTVFT